jgi:hypothetical protein
MKKLLLITGFLLLSSMEYVKASADARVTECQFDNVLATYLNEEATVKVIEQAEHDAYGKTLPNGSYSYVFFADGVYYSLYKNGRKEFTNSKIKVIPVRDIFINKQQV